MRNDKRKSRRIAAAAISIIADFHIAPLALHPRCSCSEWSVVALLSPAAPSHPRLSPDSSLGFFCGSIPVTPSKAMNRASAGCPLTKKASTIRSSRSGTSDG